MYLTHVNGWELAVYELHETKLLLVSFIEFIRFKPSFLVVRANGSGLGSEYHPWPTDKSGLPLIRYLEP